MPPFKSQNILKFETISFTFISIFSIKVVQPKINKHFRFKFGARLSGYLREGAWVPTDAKGNVVGHDKNCTDPKRLFDAIVSKPSDFFEYIKFRFERPENGSRQALFLPYLDNGIITNTDHEKYGRCYTALPTSHMVSRKIQEVYIGLKINGNGSTPRVIFHAPGTFRRGITEKNGYFIRKKPDSNRTSQAFIFEYEVLTRLEKGSIPPCEVRNDFNYDMCIHKHIERESLAKFGCTTPFGPNKSQICSNTSIAQEVLKLYYNIMGNKTSVCKVPCKTYSIRVMKKSSHERFDGKSEMKLILKDDVLLSEEQFLYSPLSLIAEVGGYVGLFLGVSVKQFSTLMELLFNRFKRWVNNFTQS